MTVESFTRVKLPLKGQVTADQIVALANAITAAGTATGVDPATLQVNITDNAIIVDFS